MPSLSARDLAIAQRFSYGTTPELVADVRRAGGGRAWFEKQTIPSRVKDRPRARIDRFFPSLNLDPGELQYRNDQGIESWWVLVGKLSCRTVLWRAVSHRQLQEVMTEFWSNLLHVPLMDDGPAFHRAGYEAMIRRLALTSFDQILGAAVTHPAMGLYLDNATSTKQLPNENLGRELLELHTVGVDAGYTEAHVKASARILTGYQVDLDTMAPYYNKWAHATGRVKVLTFSHANKDPDGRAVAKAYLHYLAHHPATAKRLARRLCVRFVSDSPSANLVNTVAAAFRRHDTKIVPTLQALVSHPEFVSASGAKVRPPGEEYVATLRRLGVDVAKPTSDQSFAYALQYQVQNLGQRPYDWPAPNGFPESGAAWSGAGRVLVSADSHRTLAHGWWPTQQVTYRTAADWLPPSMLPLSVDKAVAHIGSSMFGVPVPKRTRTAAATAIGLSPDYQLTTATAGTGRVLGLVAALLDSPTHLTR